MGRGFLPSAISYPEELPITGYRTEIVAALQADPVVVVAGGTGSGKSTQLPKMCLEAGRGATGMVGHTQPRRIAARSVAERVAEELGTQVGEVVGFKVRFSDRVREGTRVKLMTDGVLLAELRGDPLLRQYDTLIVDEAHERSLNIDFILGYLKRLLPERPDLKVLITSATIDTEKFSAHFGGAPVIEVPDRAFPVEVRYRPLGPGANGDKPDEVQAVCEAVAELCRQGPGDILVFFSGEREIRDAAEALAKSGPPGLEILALYARLPADQQHRVFRPHAGRRVVLATNVAETSLTVPGIRYVVDLGTARISRYSRRTKVQRLPIEPVSQASADQRAGRCGRLGPGVCLRLYSEEDLAARRRFTEPEILRTNLASVILQMAAIGLGPVEDFPFVDPPDRRNVRDGVALLQELGALSAQGELTHLGRRLAQLPLDPRLGRAVLEGAERGCLAETVVIAAALSVQDPRERPAGKELAAEGGRGAGPASDFMGYLALWHLMGQAGEEGQFRRFCRQHMVNYQRAREWQDVASQVWEVCRQLGLARGRHQAGLLPSPGGPLGRAVHQALLAGLVGNVGVRAGEGAEYLGARNARFAIWPGSALARANKLPRWVMAAEVVETRRLWARVVAPVKPQWVEQAAAHLLKWSWSEPAWSSEQGRCEVLARATLYGLPVVVARRVDFAALDQPACREMFIRRALVEGDWEGAPPFVARNRAVVDQLRSLAQRCRHQELAAAEEALFSFYASRLGPLVTSGPELHRWLARAGDARLEVTAAELVGTRFAWPAPEDYPEQWRGPDGSCFALSYNWRPGEDDDGVVAEVPFDQLGRLSSSRLEWQVPGYREELVVALVRSLPKALRRGTAPLARLASSFVSRRGPGDGPLAAVLAQELAELTGSEVAARDFDWAKVPAYLRPLCRVVGADGRVIAASRDLVRLEQTVRTLARRALARSGRLAGLCRSGLLGWELDELPRRFEAQWRGGQLAGYPALVDEGHSVGVQVLGTEAEQATAMRTGVSRLVTLSLGGRLARLERLLDGQARAALAAGGSYRSARELAEDVGLVVVEDLVSRLGYLVWDRQSFEALVESVGRCFDQAAGAVMASAGRVVARLAAVRRRLGGLAARAASLPPGAPSREAVEDVRRQLARLAGPGFVRRAGIDRLEDLERYLMAADQRLAKLSSDPGRDQRLAQQVRQAEGWLARAGQGAPAGTAGAAPGAQAALEELGWMVEELRVSLFAQSLGTRVPVSVERLQRAAERLLA